MKETFIIIGEGPTEYFFLTSLKDEFRTLQNIDPQYPKHTSMAELELKIKKATEQGYNQSPPMHPEDCLEGKSLDFL